ncbi:MAG: response regulator [Methylococcaceae bacterium]
MNVKSLNGKGSIYLIDDDALIRESLLDALGMMGFEVIEFSSAVLFLKNLMSIVRPSVIVLDMQMLDMTGIELQAQLLAQKILIPVIFISGESYPQQIITGMKQGAVDFLLKPFCLNELVAIVTTALEVDLTQSIYENRFASLTTREKEVFVLLVKGNSNKALACELNVTESMIKLHKSRIMTKMQATSVQELTAYYLHLKLLI